MAKDQIFVRPLQTVGDFVFDEAVVDVFSDMIARSVPGYSSVLAMTIELAEQYAVPGSNVYDLGCSLGAASIPISARVPSGVEIYAVDSSPAMIAKFRERLSDRQSVDNHLSARIHVIEDDVAQVRMENASFVVMNFTLQFVPLERRNALIGRIAEAIRPGGAFVLSEKIRFENPNQQELMTELHHAFKRAHGYSDLEIAQKRSALENTLIAESVAQHQRRLLSAGFQSASPWFQCFNFASFIATKAN